MLLLTHRAFAVNEGNVGPLCVNLWLGLGYGKRWIIDYALCLRYAFSWENRVEERSATALGLEALLCSDKAEIRRGPGLRCEAVWQRSGKSSLPRVTGDRAPLSSAKSADSSGSAGLQCWPKIPNCQPGDSRPSTCAPHSVNPLLLRAADSCLRRRPHPHRSSFR